MSTTRNLLTPGEAAEIVRLTPRQITRLARDGVIPAVVLPGDEIRFDERDLWTWVEQQKRPAGQGGADA
jgi:excisionase family DNA binding protein